MKKKVIRMPGLNDTPLGPITAEPEPEPRGMQRAHLTMTLASAEGGDQPKALWLLRVDDQKGSVLQIEITPANLGTVLAGRGWVDCRFRIYR